MTTSSATGGLLVPAVGWLMGGLLAGCVAQEADLRQAERDLQKKIKQSNEELAQTRARQNQEITNLREQELPKLEGKIEVAAKQAEVLSHAQEDLKTRAAGLDKRAAELEKRLGWAEKTLVEQDNLLKAQDNLLKSERERVRAELTGEVGKASTRLDILQKSVESLAQKIDARLDEQQKTMRAGEAKAGALSHQIETQNKSIQDQVVKLTIALADFKLGLSAVNDRLGQQDQAIKHLQTSLEQEASASAKRTDALSAKVDADTKAATAHINEVNRALMGHVAELNKSVTSVAKALETAGGKFMARIDDQDHRLESLSKNLEQLRDSSRARQRQGGTKPAPRAGMIPAGETTTQSGSATSSGDDEDTASTSEAKAAEGDSSASPVAAAGEKTDREAYEQVLAKFKDGNMEGAREGFAKFLDDYPNSTLAPNARYWLGESYYSQKDYKHAIDSYSRVERDYPQSEKVPAAILKKGFAYLALKDRKQASTAFKRVMTLYPKSSEAGKASDKLTQLERAR